MDIGTFRASEAVERMGKTLEQIACWKKYEATVLAVNRGSRTLPNFSGETTGRSKIFCFAICLYQNREAVEFPIVPLQNRLEPGGTPPVPMAPESAW